jgi:Kef-type K+ transport system membrane component KefB
VDNFTTAVAVGCSFGPTSAGIALEVLQPCGVLATPLGQLIVAIAIIDDIIALVVLSPLQALTANNGSGNDNYGGGVKAAAIVVPIVSALAWLFAGGGIALYVICRNCSRNWIIWNNEPCSHAAGSTKGATERTTMTTTRRSRIIRWYYH